MQSPSASPPATQAPPGGVSVEVPGVAGPIGLPRTAEEVAGVRQKRDILRDQLNRATNRRSELVSQLRNESAVEGRAGIQQRLTLLDARILEIEQEQAAAERLLSNTSPAVLALTVDQGRGKVDEDEAIAGAFAAFGFGIVATLVISRIRRRFRRGKTPAPILHSGAIEPRLEQLSQSMDAIAEEVERIGEGQRFVTQLLSRKAEAPHALGSRES